MMDDPESILENPYFNKIVGSHREWLMHFDEQYLRKWDDLFTKNNSEAALCEAATRQVLEEFGVDVEPYDDSSNESTPDFKCHKNGIVFYAEVTCITKEIASKKTGLEDIPKNIKTSSFALLTDMIFGKARNREDGCLPAQA